MKKILKRYYLYLSISLLVLASCGSGSSSTTSSSSLESTVGKAGSMARFAIVDEYLYTMNGSQMNIFDISTASSPQSVSKVRLPWDVETLFSYKEYLYIGASSGMYIYDNSVPTQPTKITTFTHAQSCDPVVVHEDVAYITLNTQCRNPNASVNRLEIVDVRNPLKPILLKQLDMWSPKGLGIDDNLLFICDGDAGLKIFDVNKTEDNNTINIALDSLSSDNRIDCFDVIAFDKHLIISNQKEIKQFDYSSFPMQELGRIQ